MEALRHLSHKEILSELEQLILEKRKVRGISPKYINTCREGVKRMGSRLFPCPVTGHRGDEHSLKHRKFLLSIRKHLFPVRMTEHRLPREVVASSFMEICESHLDVILLELGGWIRWHPEVPAHLSHSLTL